VLETREVQARGGRGRYLEEFTSGKSKSKVRSLSVSGAIGGHGPDPLGGILQERDRREVISTAATEEQAKVRSWRSVRRRIEGEEEE
jgi:hypothetical protein